MMVWHALRNLDLRDVPARARALEALGYDFITTPESKHDPFLPLTLVAEHTERLRFSTSVAIAFPRAPYITANLAWDLARYSGGRFVLGLGTQVKGHNERRFSVPWGPPGPRLRDYIRCIRAIWHCWQHGAKPDFEGEYYRYTLTNPDFDPGPIEHPRRRHRDLRGESLQHAPRGRALRRHRCPSREQLPPSARGGAASRLRGRAPRRV